MTGSPHSWVRRRRAAAVAAAAIAALVAAGCSTTSTTSSPSGGGGSGASGTGVDTAALAAGYKGSFDPPPSSGPAAQKGKNVWYISCGQAYVACASSAVSFKEAGTALGWNVTIVDGKADPSTAANAIKQAVNGDVDGVALFTYDCPGLKSALLQAKAANMPVVNYGSLDCDDSAFGGEPLFAASVKEQDSTNQADMWGVLGKARADYVAASVGADGGTVININETSQRAHQYQQIAFAKEIADKCPKCKVVDVPFTFSQVPNPATAIWKSALLKNPDAKAITWDTDALMGLGLSSAIQQSRRGSDLLKIGAEGNLPNMELIRSGQQTSSSFIPYGWYQWAAADTLNRLFSGEKAADLPSQGGGFQYVDKDHNLPAAGQPVKVAVDYQSAYKAVWNG